METMSLLATDELIHNVVMVKIYEGRHKET